MLINPLTRLSDWVARKSSWKLVAILAVVLAAWLWLAGVDPPGGPILDLQWSGYSAEEAHAWIEGYGPEGRRRYIDGLLLNDALAPLLVAAVLAFTLSATYKMSSLLSSRWHRLNLLPLVSMVADYTENVAGLTLLVSFPAGAPRAAMIGSVATVVKWTNIQLIVLCWLAGVLLLLYRRSLSK